MSLRAQQLFLLAFLVFASRPSNVLAISSRTMIVPTGTTTDERFGFSVASAGDVNGDGYADLIVGAYLSDAGGNDAGRAYVYYGGPSVDATADLTFTGTVVNGSFGISVASAGDVDGDGYADLIVGASLANQAYLYFGGPSADAIADRTFAGTAGSFFGRSVASAGDVNGDGYADLLVGASAGDRVYLYFGGPSADTTADLTLTGQVSGDVFGYAIASAGDVNGDDYDDIIVGASGNDAGGTNAGRAYVYFGGPSADATADLTFTGAAMNDALGLSVASAGDVNGDSYADVIVGAPLNDTGGMDAGRAYVYFGGPSADLLADRIFTGAVTGDQFGYAVASAGDANGDGFPDFVVGAYLSSAGAGRAYLFFGGPSADTAADLTFTGEVGGFFGISVASAGDVNGDGHADLIVGAEFSDAGVTDGGAAYVYAVYPYQVTSPNGGEIWMAGDAVTVSWLGHDVADVSWSTDGGASWSVLASSVGGDDENAFSLTAPGPPTALGKVRLSYTGQPATHATSDQSDAVFRTVDTPSPDAASRLQLTPTGAAAGDFFGFSVASAGDVNGDAYADVIVGAYNNDAGGSNAGRAYVYFGGPSADAVADLTVTGATAGDNFGFSVASAGDVNRDGYDDVVVGAYFNDAAGIDAGRAYVYFGGLLPDAVADLTLTGATGGDNFGTSVASAGDVNRDGYDDVIIGSPFNDAGGTDAGRVHVYYGGPAPDATADLTFTGAAGSDFFGLSVASVGDANGDGYADVIVGASGNDAGGTMAGRAYVFFGRPATDVTPDLILTGVAGDNFGFSVASAGDANGDGYDDVIIGAWGNDAGGANAGRAYVYFGGPAADDVADLVLTGAAAGDNFGFSVASAGDVNGDAYADLIVGGHNNDAGGSNAGRAYVYFGGPADAIDDLTFTGVVAGDNLGASVAAAGDVNGDVFADLIVGAFNNDAGGANAGRAYVYDLKRYQITAPNGGETWNVGAVKTISWLGAEPADVWLSVDGGQSYDLLQSDAGGVATNSLPVRVPHSPTRFARFKLTPTDEALMGVDASDSTFTIQSSVTLLSFEASRGAEGTKLSWSSDPAVGPEGILGYRLYRFTGDLGGGVRIGGDLIVETQYTDAGGMPGATYQLIAVNGLSEELELGRVTAGEAMRGMKVWPSPVSMGAAGAGGASGSGGVIRVAFAAPGTSGASGSAPLHDLDVAVYDIAGRRVATIARGPAVASSSGVISLAWDGRNAAGSPVAPGAYIVRAIASSGGLSLERKIIVVR